ncbi:MAG: MFS transporter [Novosphingobium sp.]|nr:MFS transporter [Novosphingobium sp.]
MSHERLADNEWRTGWPVIVASLAGLMLISFYTFSFGAFIGPIEQDTGWSRAQISIGLSIITITAGILTPALGWVVDRLGPRRVGLPGAISFALTYGLLGLTTDNVWTWWGIWLLLSFTIIGIKPLVWTTAVASTFHRNRGLALAIALCGNGLTQAFAPSLSNWAIGEFGWRGAYPFLAFSLGAVVIPILFFGLHSGADRRKRKDSQGQDADTAAPALYGMLAREAFRTRRFYMLALAAFVFTLAAIGIVPNLMPILSSFGFGRTEAAAIAGVAGISSILGRIGTGWLLDRFNPNLVAGVVVLVPVVSCLLLVGNPGNATVAIVAVAIVGVALGSEVDVMAFMTARQFGTRSYGTIFGVISGLWAIATGLGPTIANRIYDVTGGYELALQLAIPCFVLTSALLLTLGKPPEFQQSSSNESAE